MGSIWGSAGDSSRTVRRKTAGPIGRIGATVLFVLCERRGAALCGNSIILAPPVAYRAHDAEEALRAELTGGRR